MDLEAGVAIADAKAEVTTIAAVDVGSEATVAACDVKEGGRRCCCVRHGGRCYRCNQQQKTKAPTLPPAVGVEAAACDANL